jgi:aminoglycoside/choline kinase family phosphotransferase
MTEREDAIKTFLGANGWGEAERAPLTGDASFRRYERLTLGGRQAMLMDAPPPRENVDAFVAIARHLKSLGFSAPDIFAKERDLGFLIIEDLGDDTFTRILASDENDTETGLYSLAVDLLIELHGIAPERVAPPDTETYSDEKLLEEARLLCDWTWGALFGAPPEVGVSGSYQAAWREAFGHLRGQPATLVLRDYHVDNLMVLQGRSGIARCGLLDFQDAVLGPKAYDLASLLEDARRDIGPGLKGAMLERYFTAFPDLDRDQFTAAFAVLAAQRHAKVIGIFTRLYLRDGKPGYLQHIPRVWRLLEDALSHPALAPVADWFDTHIPPAKRITPSQEQAAS